MNPSRLAPPDAGFPVSGGVDPALLPIITLGSQDLEGEGAASKGNSEGCEGEEEGAGEAMCSRAGAEQGEEARLVEWGWPAGPAGRAGQLEMQRLDGEGGPELERVPILRLQQR